jgi:predicted kinase
VRALASLRDEGAIRGIGLCNVTVGQIEAARAITEIASVQVSLSVLDAESLRNGVAEYCRDHGVLLIGHRPLGGERAQKLARDALLADIGAKHGATAQEIALAWLVGFGGSVVPIPGATRVETARSIARVTTLTLDDEDRARLDARFSGRLLRVPRAQRRPPPGAEGDVVIVMGMPGAGKSTVARELEAHGYERLNRDALGGSLADLVPRLHSALAAGRRRVVLDNTYPSRASRNEVIECAWAQGVPVRCVWLATGVADAQINAITRMIEAHGRLPSPEEIRERGKQDPRYLAPTAQFGFERTIEPPAADEGFTEIETRPFTRERARGSARALILDVDDLMGGTGRREVLARYRDEGWLLFAHAWRPKATDAQVEAELAKARARFGADLELACCVHDAGPPACWCRKPIPGPVLEFVLRRGVSLEDSIVVARSAADRTMAERLGAAVRDSESFWS